MKSWFHHRFLSFFLFNRSTIVTSAKAFSLPASECRADMCTEWRDHFFFGGRGKNPCFLASYTHVDAFLFYIQGKTLYGASCGFSDCCAEVLGESGVKDEAEELNGVEA